LNKNVSPSLCNLLFNAKCCRCSIAETRQKNLHSFSLPSWVIRPSIPKLSKLPLSVSVVLKCAFRSEGREGEKKEGGRRGPQYTFLATPLRKKGGERARKREKTKRTKKKLSGKGRGESVRVGERLPPGVERGWTPLHKGARYTHGHYGPPIGSGPPRVEWSRVT